MCLRHTVACSMLSAILMHYTALYLLHMPWGLALCFQGADALPVHEPIQLVINTLLAIFYTLCTCSASIKLLTNSPLAGYLDDMHVFDPETNIWTPLSALESVYRPSARFQHGFTSAGGKLYVHGGWSYNSSTCSTYPLL